MHIGFQRSGGRGEYEIVGSHSGYNAISLEGWTFDLAWPDGIVRETGLGLEPADSGKPRLRSLRDRRFQIGRMLAAMLFMPDPRRSFAQVGDDAEVLRGKGYVLTKIGFGPDTEFSGINDVVKIDPVFLEAENAGAIVTIGVLSRWNRVRRIYDMRDQLPASLRDYVETHRTIMTSGQPITEDLTRTVRAMGAALPHAISGWDPAADPLAGAEGLLGITSGNEPNLPAPPDIGEEEGEVAARSAFEWRLAKSRGSSAGRFRRAVQNAYKDRCVFCGGIFRIEGAPSGLDAAHILAWSHHDLDVASNGLMLCKLHHWAFDGSLMVPYLDSGGYTVRFTTLAITLDSESRRLLGQDGRRIPDEWLPDDVSLRPSARYLSKLYADLSIELLN